MSQDQPANNKSENARNDQHNKKNGGAWSAKTKRVGDGAKSRAAGRGRMYHRAGNGLAGAIIDLLGRHPLRLCLLRERIDERIELCGWDMGGIRILEDGVLDSDAQGI